MRPPDSADVRLAYKLFAEADGRFHAAIAAAGRNALLHDMLTRQAVHLRLFRPRLNARATSEAVAGHGLIVDALVAGDPDVATSAMRTHIERASARFADVDTQRHLAAARARGRGHRPVSRKRHGAAQQTDGRSGVDHLCCNAA